ncbi:MAG TPA: inorganic diphosphatase [Candidatus Bathyarchaeia archaeon]|nr:inorganic diphosphatase [Candidatus Bathyarchaeia archaeon]
MDPKVIAVPLAKIDPTFSAILDINDIQENVLTQLKHFIEHHKDLEERKCVKLLGWQGKDAAKVMISEAIKRYNKSADA